jgi:ATP-dependent helicase/nuclease subunit A
MDAYFEEEDGFVIVDYKTDHVETAQQLKDRYETQLDYYAKALNQITGKQVKEKILCSIHLHELVSWK